MVSRNEILNALPRYQNKYEHIADNQSVSDIMAAMKYCHKKYKKDYDKICGYFIGATEYKTCKNIFNFLRKYTNYVIETEDEQTVKSPSALLEQQEIDCKGYALFACGVLDAINRTGKQNIPNAYRFVSDSIFSTTANHVFCVAFPCEDQNFEIWIDPIPQIKNFDDRLTFYYSTDKKNKMSLYAISGVEDIPVPGIGLSANDVAGLLNTVTSIFTKNKNQYLNDWKGWDAQDRAAGRSNGSSVRGYILGDGDYPDIEAKNILSYIAAYGFNNLMKGNEGGFTGGDSRLTKDGKSWRNVTFEEIADKLNRGGLPQEADAIMQKVRNGGQNMLNNGSSPISFLNNTGNTQNAGMNMYVTLAIVAAGIFFLYKSNKK